MILARGPRDARTGRSQAASCTSAAASKISMHWSRDRAARAVEGASPTRSLRQSEAAAVWTLPFRRSAVLISRQAMDLEFRRLDLRGEGRLTFLTLKSALELREVHIDDQTIRKWLKETDRDGKGYVDFADYETIYIECQGTAAAGTGLGRYGASASVPDRPTSASASSSSSSSSSLGRRSGPDKAAAQDRAALLRR